MTTVINSYIQGSNLYLINGINQVPVNINESFFVPFTYATEIPIQISNSQIITYENLNPQNFPQKKIKTLKYTYSSPVIFPIKSQNPKKPISYFTFSKPKNYQNIQSIQYIQNSEIAKSNYIPPETEPDALNSSYYSLNNYNNNIISTNEDYEIDSDSNIFNYENTINDQELQQSFISMSNSYYENTPFVKNVNLNRCNTSQSMNILPYYTKDVHEIDRKTFNPSDYKIIKNIGNGIYRQIFYVQSLLNNRHYALKKETYNYPELIQNSIQKTKMLYEFFDKTNSNKVIKIYGDKLEKVGNKLTYYTLLEVAEIDWEKEIFFRRKRKNFYNEQEILNILYQLIKCLSELQKNHISHRDIKPSNILIVKGLYKLCDFGESRKIEGDGLLCSRARGTEIYMSPILFHGLISGSILVQHNTYKSDVYSLGICFIYAITLRIDCITYLRNIDDMQKMKQSIYKFIYGRYSKKVFDILVDMLQIDENLRPDFIQLEAKYFP